MSISHLLRYFLLVLREDMPWENGFLSGIDFVVVLGRSDDTVCLQPADEKEDAERHGVAGFLVFFLHHPSWHMYLSRSGMQCR